MRHSRLAWVKRLKKKCYICCVFFLFNRNESREILVKYVARFNGTGFYLPLSTEETMLKPLSNYSAELFYAPSTPIEQKLPIVSKVSSIILPSAIKFVSKNISFFFRWYVVQSSGKSVESTEK